MFCSIVKPKTTSEQAIAIAIMYYIIGICATHGINPSHHFTPNIHIMLVVTHNCRLACSPARAMHSDYLGHRHTKQPKWIVVSKILFFCKWKFSYIIYTFYILWQYSKLIKLLFIKGVDSIHSTSRFSQSLQLCRFYIFPRCTLSFAPYHTLSFASIMALSKISIFCAATLAFICVMAALTSSTVNGKCLSFASAIPSIYTFSPCIGNSPHSAL